MESKIFVLQVGLEESSDVLLLPDPAVRKLLEGAVTGQRCLMEWPDDCHGIILGNREIDFLRLEGYPNMLDFRSGLLANTSLEGYLLLGEYLPVNTLDGPFVVWHPLAEASRNTLETSSTNSVETEGGFRFIKHRLSADSMVCTLTSIKGSPLFIEILSDELPAALGGTNIHEALPSGSWYEDLNSFPLEAKWRGWTGLSFKVIWSG